MKIDEIKSALSIEFKNLSRSYSDWHELLGNKYLELKAVDGSRECNLHFCKNKPDGTKAQTGCEAEVGVLNPLVRNGQNLPLLLHGDYRGGKWKFSINDDDADFFPPEIKKFNEEAVKAAWVKFNGADA